MPYTPYLLFKTLNMPSFYDEEGEGGGVARYAYIRYEIRGWLRVGCTSNSYNKNNEPPFFKTCFSNSEPANADSPDLLFRVCLSAAQRTTLQSVLCLRLFNRCRRRVH